MCLKWNYVHPVYTITLIIYCHIAVIYSMGYSCYSFILSLYITFGIGHPLPACTFALFFLAAPSICQTLSPLSYVCCIPAHFHWQHWFILKLWFVRYSEMLSLHSLPPHACMSVYCVRTTHWRQQTTDSGMWRCMCIGLAISQDLGLPCKFIHICSHAIIFNCYTLCHAF